MSHFPEELKNLRLKRGLTQAALAGELHVTQNAIFNWENGRRDPSIEMIQKIADYFQVSVAYLFAEKESYRTVLRFLDAFSKEKAHSDSSMASALGSSKESPHDFLCTDQSGIPLAAIECMGTDKSYAHLMAYAEKCYQWYQKTYEPLNVEGRCKVAEYAEILSESERFQRKMEEPA